MSRGDWPVSSPAVRTPPSQADLDDLLADAVRFEILDGAPDDARPVEARRILESEAASDLRRLREVLRIAGGGRCMCAGDATLCIYRRDGSRATIGLHHGTSIRWDSRWSVDARVVSAGDFADFLAERAWPRYRDQLNEGEQRAAETDAALAKWVAAMPAPLRSFEEALVRDGVIGAERRARGRLDLVAALDSEAAAVHALLRWYGSGKGPWSGFPAYESIAADLLMTFSVAVLVDVLRGDLDEVALRGAARHCAGWHFRSLRKKLPQDVVTRLRAHVERAGDPEHRDAFARAFR